MTEKHLLLTSSAATYIGVTRKTLERDRRHGTLGAIPFLRINSRIFYRKRDLDQFLDDHLEVPSAPTSNPAPMPEEAE